MRAPAGGAFQRVGHRIKRRIIWAFFAFGTGAASTWTFREEVFNWLLVPGGGALSPFGGLPVFTAPTDMMGATIGLAIKGGAFAAVPVIIVGASTLLLPLFPPRQRRFFIIFVPTLVAFFVGGAAFAYYVMLPVGINFLLHFGDGISVPVISITAYLDLMFAMMLWLGVIFELPLMMFLLAKMRIISYRRMRRFRKFVPFAAFFLSAIITPGADPATSIMVGVPIIALYEFGVFLAWVARPEEGDYLFIMKIRSALTVLLWRLYTLPAAMLHGLAAAPARLWRRLRRGRGKPD